jgi:hypothetical protein
MSWVIKKGLLLVLSILLILPLYGQNRYWISSTSSNWNNTANWSTTSGGAGGASVPGAGNTAVFDGAGGRNGICNLDVAPTVTGITMNGYSGTLNLSGFTITTTGNSTFATGTISNSGGSASVALNTTVPSSTTFSGTVFNADVTGTSGRLFFNGSTFNGIVSLTKSGTLTEASTGGNTFNNTVDLTNGGTGLLQLGGTNPDIFQSALTLSVNSTGNISLAYASAGNQFNGNILVNYGNTANVLIGANGGTSTLANGFTISVGSVGAAGPGNLQLSNFTQSGTTAQNITLSGNNSATLTIGPASTFNADLTLSAPNLGLQTSTFKGVTQLTKTGNPTSNLRGGNLFTGVTTITNQGGDLIFGSNPADPGDTFNGTSTFYNLGGNRIRIAEETSGTVFNGDVTFYSSAATDVNNRIQISRLAGGQTTFNGSATFINNGNASDIHISYDAGTSTTFNGPVYFISNAYNTGDFFVGVDGNVIFTNNVEFTSTCTDDIYITNGTGTATFSNGTMTIGAGGFAQGGLRFINFTQTGSASQSLTLTGTSVLRLGPASTFNGSTTFITPQIYLNGATFNGTTYIEKTGATSNTGTGNNVFNGVTTLVNSGSGSFISGNTSVDTFNNDLTLTNSGSAYISMANNSSGNVFNGNITVNCTGGNGIYFGNGTSGSATLAAGKTISIGSSGFTAGQLRLTRFRQTGATAQSLTLTGTALIQLGPSSQFDGNVNFIAPQLLLNGTTFNGTAYLEKNGTTDNVSTGGNTYNGATTLVNSSPNTLDLADTSPDVFNSSLVINNTGSYRTQIGISSAGNIFNGSVTINHGGNTPTAVNTIIARNAGATATFNSSLTINCTNAGANSGVIIANDGSATINGNVLLSSTNGRGILFGSSTGTVTLASGFTIKDNGAGSFTTGTLTMKGFTQVGSGAQSITMTGTSNLVLGPSSSFNGAVNFVTPQIYLNGCTFNGTTYLEKSGATANTGTGSNIFNGVTTLVNSGSGAFISGNSSNDSFNNNLTLTNTGSSYISVADNSSGNIFGGNITVNSTGGLGIYFGNNSSASATLASTKTIAVGGSGFTAGELRLSRFTQTGSTAQSLTFTGTASLRLGPSSQFDGNVTFISPQVYLNGATYNGTAYIEKNGAAANTGTGANVFNTTTTLVNSGTNDLYTANNNPDTFNGQLTVTNTGTGIIYLAHNVTGTTFNSNIIVNSTNSSGGIYFANNATGGATLASGATITVGASGFRSGELRLRRFTQLGSTALNLTFLTNAALRVGPSATFNADVTYTGPQVYLDGAVFNGTVSIQKNGTTNNDNAGGNTFNAVATFTNSSSSRWRLAGTNGDTFASDVTFVRSSTGAFDVAYAQTNSFGGNLTVNSTGGITFGGGGGTVQINGSGSQSVSKTVGSVSPTIPILTMAKSSGALTLNTDVTISNTATFTNGIVNTTSTNFLNFASGATATGMSNSSYVDGPVRKTGNNAFTFPVGSAGYYRPISISAPSNVAHQFTAQYFYTSQGFGGPSTWDASFTSLSSCDYWILDRTTGTSNVFVTLSWISSICPVYSISSLSNLTVARFNAGTSKWTNEGNGSTTGTPASGTITTAAAVTNFSPFTLASTNSATVLPIELGPFWAINQGQQVLLKWITYSETNNQKFTIQRSSSGIDFQSIGELKGAGNSNQALNYEFADEKPLNGLSYYRLKQTDFDGKESFSSVISVQREGQGSQFDVYPNPVNTEWLYLNEKATITIFTTLNQQVISAHEVEKVNVSRLTPGLYLIRNQKGEVTRFVKE